VHLTSYRLQKFANFLFAAQKFFLLSLPPPHLPGLTHYQLFKLNELLQQKKTKNKYKKKRKEAKTKPAH
jgi:hypothetical protein